MYFLPSKGARKGAPIAQDTGLSHCVLHTLRFAPANSYWSRGVLPAVSAQFRVCDRAAPVVNTYAISRWSSTPAPERAATSSTLCRLSAETGIETDAVVSPGQLAVTMMAPSSSCAARLTDQSCRRWGLRTNSFGGRSINQRVTLSVAAAWEGHVATCDRIVQGSTGRWPARHHWRGANFAGRGQGMIRDGGCQLSGMHYTCVRRPPSTSMRARRPAWAAGVASAATCTMPRARP